MSDDLEKLIKLVTGQKPPLCLDTSQPIRESFSHGYLGNERNPGRCTLSIHKQGVVVYVGVAFCSPKDIFQKARGRGISSSRAKSTIFGERRTKNMFAFELDLEDKPISVAGQAWNHLNDILEEVGNSRILFSTVQAPKWAVPSFEFGYPVCGYL